MRIIPLLAALILASCSQAPEKTPAKKQESQAPSTTGAEGETAPDVAATGEYKPFDGSGKVYPLSKAFASYIAALEKTKPKTPEPGPSPNAAPRGIITVNGKGYSYFGSLWRDDKEYWKSPQLDEFWKFLNEHPAEEIPSFEPSGAGKPQ